MEEPPHESRRRLTVALGIFASCAIAALLAVGLHAIRRDVIAGPEFVVQIGDFHIIAETTAWPECLPLSLQRCWIMFPIPLTPPARYYTIWAGSLTYIPTKGPDAIIPVSNGRRILQLRIGP